MNASNERRKPLGPLRRTSFSLRAMLVVMAVLAVWLGLHFQSVKKQRAAIEAVLQCGGSVHYDYELTENLHRSGKGESPVPDWLLGAIGPDHFHAVIFVDFGTEKPAKLEAVLKHLSGLSQLEKLMVGNTQLADSDLEYIGELRRLRVLGVRNGQKITDDGMSHLSRLDQLERLILGKYGMTEASVQVLSSLPKLKELWLPGNHFADGALKHMQNMTELRTLALGHDVHDDDLRHLGRLDQLEKLGMQYSGVTENGLRHLTHLKNLRVLLLEGSKVRDATMLQKQLPNCRIVPDSLVP